MIGEWKCQLVSAELLAPFLPAPSHFAFPLIVFCMLLLPLWDFSWFSGLKCPHPLFLLVFTFFVSLIPIWSFTHAPPFYSFISLPFPTLSSISTFINMTSKGNIFSTYWLYSIYNCWLLIKNNNYWAFYICEKETALTKFLFVCSSWFIYFSCGVSNSQKWFPTLLLVCNLPTRIFSKWKKKYSQPLSNPVRLSAQTCISQNETESYFFLFSP